MSSNESFCEIRGQGFVMMHDWLIEGDLSDKALRVYMVLARHGQNPTNCFPSINRIATKLKCSGRTVQRCIDELVQYGAVKRESRYDGSGSQRSNGYLIWAGFTPPTPAGSHFEAPNPMTSVSPPPRHPCHAPPDMYVTHKENQLTKTSEQENTRVDSRENAQQPLIEVDGLTPAASPTIGFDEFWERYPRKVGKEAARKAWTKLVKAKTDPQTIMDRLDIWLEFWDVPRQGVQYVKHPQGWMNSGLYLDDPRIERVAPQHNRTPVASSRRFSTVIEGDF